MKPSNEAKIAGLFLLFFVIVKMKKSAFRKQQKARLLLFAQSKQKEKEDHCLTRRLLTSQLLANCHTIGVTFSLPLEVNTQLLIKQLWRQGKKVYLAKADPGPQRKLNFLPYSSQSKLKKTSLGVWEVADKNVASNNRLDLLLVPGLAFALNNHARLGFGGGYYDRFLKRYRGVRTVALANSRMIFAQALWPIAKTDVPVQTIITPAGIYDLKK